MPPLAARHGMTAGPRAWHAIPHDVVLDTLKSTAAGLTEAEARARLSRDGPNEIAVTAATPWWRVLASQFRSVVVLLLVVAAALAAATDERLDALAILVVLAVNVALGFLTEWRAHRALEALRSLESRRATVVREGRTLDVDARSIVRGDVILLAAGQSVPADARVIEATELRTSEAALTGESLPVSKDPGVVVDDAPLAERTNMVYLGTTIVAGAGTAVIVATGSITEVGRIGGLAASVQPRPTLLERRLDTLGRQLAAGAIFVAALIGTLALWQGAPWHDVLRTALAIAIAAVPEGLPTVVTVTLAIGVHRMARRRALVRRLPIVESLGAATVICTDKTGTLTTGDMTVTSLWVEDREIRTTGAGYAPQGQLLEGDVVVDVANDPGVALALRIAALANRAQLVRDGADWEPRGDPTEAALLVLAAKGDVARDRLLPDWPEAGELPFTSERMLMATYHRGGAGLVAHLKGAPAAVLERCTTVRTREGPRPLDASRRTAILSRNEAMAMRGLRVLALAAGDVASTDEAVLEQLCFVGLAGMIDAPAPDVRASIDKLSRAGIRTIMLTGDQRHTAEAIAAELGILRPGDEGLDGRAIARLTDEELRERMARVATCSRVDPEGKLRIVAALQERGDVVAMLGDGVNDAAALRRADVGVAMGRRGTDVARETAGVVLEDDRFPTIVAAVEEGRVIYDNVGKFVFYLFSCNLAEILLLLATGVLGLPLPLLPLQLLWINLVSDSFPALALAFEPGDPDVMERRPREPGAPILSRPVLRATLGYAVVIAACAFVAFSVGLRGGNLAVANTMAFMTLALAQLLHLGNARSAVAVLRPARAFANRFALVAVVVGVVLQVASAYVPVLARVLDLAALQPQDWAVVATTSVVPALGGQLLKAWVHRKRTGPAR